MVRPRHELGPRLRRALAMLPWLLERGEVPVREVAERFGLGEDDVVADIGLIGAFGVDERAGLDRLEVDIWEDDDTGEAVVHAFRGALLAAPPRLTDAHSFAVLTAGRALLAVPGADPSGALGRALGKLESALGDDAAVAVDLEQPEHLGIVQEAAAGRQRLHIEYWSQYRDVVAERRIDPLAVYSLRGRWYVLGWDEPSGEHRRFRVDRIRSSRPTGETFEHDPIEPPTESFEPPADAPLVTLLLPPPGRWVVEAYEPVEEDELGDGSLRVSFYLVGERWLERLLLRVGPGALVESPEVLRDLPRRAARRLLERYEP
jgi:predicted DNA-binding transcriptional regulator YafY